MKNYTLIEHKYLDNEKSDAFVYEHDVTKAKVFVMKNDDNNKTFGIGFRTPPTDSTGVCHILEHCVLNGSKKYRTREPFMDLLKGSLQTFLNAMTFPDKTIYPVASRNDQDFRNLTDVYLDAVFNPKVLEEEKIFNQEGWRFDLEGNNLTYKGVVYNEMKGAMSGLEDQVYELVQKDLFPDSIYGLNYGGDPYEIPNLKYSNFVEYYKAYYHPSNSYIFLYGDMDHEEYLEYIHNDYLSNYEYRKVDSEITKQARFKSPRFVENKINTVKDVKPNESFASYSVILGDGTNAKERIISKILTYALIDNESSPLKQKLLSLGIADVIMSASDSNFETTFSIIAKNIDAKNINLFADTVNEVLGKMVDEGIDKELIQTVLNEYKFSIREKGGHAAKGVVYFITAFDSWLYDKSPIEAIDIFEDIQYVEDNIQNRILEDFVKERILDNPHKAIVTYIPTKNLNAKRDEEVLNFLKEKEASLSQEERRALETRKEEMDIFQNRENTPEEKATIPMLKLSDVDTKLERVEREIIELNGVTVLKNNLPTSGIDYISFAFDINHITDKEDIKYLSLLTYAMTMLDTQNYSYSDLNKKIYLNTGGINLNISQIMKKDNTIDRRLMVSTKVFSENIKSASEILIEVLRKTLFTNQARLKEVIAMISANNEMRMFQEADALMVARSKSNHNESDNYNQYVKGIDFILFVKELAEKDLLEVLSKLEAIFLKAFTRENLAINVGSDFTNKKLDEALSSVINSFEDIRFEKSTFEFTPKTVNEGFSTSADVNYLSYGNKLSAPYDSKLVVVNNILSMDYLYSEIRAKGGAYGAGMTTSNLPDSFATYSYRDPNFENTLKVYKNIPSQLESLELSEEDLLPFIIGGVGRLNPIKTEKIKAITDFTLYLANRDYSEVEEMLENALSSNLSNLKSFAPILKETLETASLAVLGKKSVIEENKSMFDRIVEL